MKNLIVRVNDFPGVRLDADGMSFACNTELSMRGRLSKRGGFVSLDTGDGVGVISLVGWRDRRDIAMLAVFCTDGTVKAFSHVKPVAD